MGAVNRSILSQRSWGRILCSGLLLAICFGCGVEEYDRRLQETSLWFAYIDRQDRNLSANWRGGPVEELRVPQQLALIPPPAAPAAPKPGEPAPPPVEIVDPRQPDYLPIRLPGLLGAWQGRVDIATETGREPKAAHLYVLANTEMLTGPDAKNAPLFLPRLLETLTGTLAKKGETGDRETHPKTRSYVPQKMYEVVRYRPEQLFGGTQYTFEVYTHSQGENQVALLVVLPTGVDPQSRINERIPMMLETLKVSAIAPKGGSKPGAPAAAPAPAVNF